MRVLVVTNMLPVPERPWLGIFVQEQIEDLRSAGLDVSVLFIRGFESAANYFRGPARIRRLMRAQPIDLVHAHYGLTGAVALTQRGVPVVTTFHGSDCSGHSTWQTAVSWAVARSSTPIFVSPELAKGLGCDGAAVVPVGVDLERFRPMDTGEARRILGWPARGIVALLPGSRGVTNKRADLFDAALDHARRSVPALRGASLEGLGRDEVALVMNAVDVTVMTSNFEGSPVTLKESLACRTPVVSVPVGDVETLVTGLPGCAVVPRDAAQIGDALVAALDAGRPAQLRERVTAFGRTGVAEQVVSVYRSALERTGSRR
jgi:glycosyltransferase involved in cell wall biosynthesis